MAKRPSQVGFFDVSTRTYNKIPIDEQSEVLSALGDIAIGDDGKASLHLHVVLGLSDGSTRGGHFIEGIVHPTLEIVIRETPAHLLRRKQADLGIALLDPGGRYRAPRGQAVAGDLALWWEGRALLARWSARDGVGGAAGRTFRETFL